MRTHAGLLLLLCLALRGASPATAAPVSITFGKGIRQLQNLVDRKYGAGRIDVTRDFIGARAGDADPFCWTTGRTTAVRVAMLKRNPDENRVGWYMEGGGQAILSAGGGVLFSGSVRSGEEAWLPLSGVRNFGFYIDGPVPVLHGPRINGPRPQPTPERFYTNRMLNDRGPDGSGAVHPPFDGDLQALIFDVSQWVGADAWLVCFEDHDTAATSASSTATMRTTMAAARGPWPATRTTTTRTTAVTTGTCRRTRTSTMWCSRCAPTAPPRLARSASEP
jgi:hypothetical protein